nr:calcium/sodium antiporter [Rubritepida sp.]
LVRGAVQIAERFGVSPLLIGLTLVGFGTSTPELVASVQAALAGSPGIAVGNIVGSNIANILLILGLAALVNPIAVSSAALARDGGLGAATAMLVVVIGLVWMLDRLVGVIFLAALAGYLVFAYRQERAQPADHTAAFDKAAAFEGVHPSGVHGALASAPGAGALGLAASGALLLGGLVLVVLGGGFLVDGAIGLARGLGVSEAVIGLTIVAVGTSMPELVTSLVAAFRRQSEVALGNVLGSNIYNVLGIGGVTALIAPTPVPAEIAHYDAFVMLLVSVLLLFIARSGWRIGRREGGLLLGGYAVYLLSLLPR